MGALAVIAAASLLTGAASLYSSHQQEEAARDAERKRQAEAAASKAEADRIARETKPEGESLGEIKYGAKDKFSGNVGNTNDFLVPKQSALGTGSTGGLSGLGFKI